MRADAYTHTTGSRLAVGAGLVLSLLASLALAIAAPLLVHGGAAVLITAFATAAALVAGAGAMVFADELLGRTASQPKELELAA